MIVRPADIDVGFARVGTVAELLGEDRDVVYTAGALHGARSDADRKVVSANYLGLRDGLVIVDDANILYLTKHGEYIPALYPKPWPYAKLRIGDSADLSVDTKGLRRRKLAGTFFVPFTLPNGNWYHRLFDNYARLHFVDLLRDTGDVTVAVPFGAPGNDAPIRSDAALVDDIFLHDLPVRRLRRGIYEVERLIAPPPANADDYLFAEPARFVSRRLASLTGTRFTHRNRIFVSRADAKRRILVNEADLTAELRGLGFTILCPGDYSFHVQLELFASADLVVGVHGQGLTPIVCASGCHAVLEFEAAGWKTTAYRAIAAALEMPYRRMPCELLGYQSNRYFDWRAKADISECIKLISQFL